MEPKQIGKYPVIGRLGEGGTAAVFAALHPEQGHELAIKVLLAGRDASESQMRRFRREASALLKLEHPNIVQLVDAGEERGIPWLAMRRVQGESLQERLDRDGPLPVADAVALGLELASALEAVHALRVLHRDVKPANVLLSPDGVAFLTDFGLAKEADVKESISVSRAGNFLGSPGYWAPEQARGEVKELGPTVDVYGLGATLYAALVGKPPIVGASLVEILIATEEQAPVPAKLREEVPRWLDRLVVTCLAKSPDDRVPTMQELREALARGAGSSSGRSRAPLILLTAVALLLVAFGVVFALRARAAAVKAQLAEEAYAAGKAAMNEKAWVEARDQLTRAAEADHGRAMAYLGFLYARGRGGVRDHGMARRWYERGIELGDGLAMSNLGYAYQKGEGVEQDLERAVFWYRRGAEAGSGVAMNNLAFACIKGRGVERDVDQGLKWMERGVALESAECMAGLGGVYTYGQGVPVDLKLGLSWYQRAVEAGSSWAMTEIGNLHLTGRGVERSDRLATEWFQRAVDAGELRALTDLARMVLVGRGGERDFERARVLLHEAAREDPRAATEIGKMYQTGSFGEPLDYAEALKWFRDAVGRGDPQGMTQLGNMYFKGWGVPADRSEAIHYYRLGVEAGHAQSMITLGTIYEAGAGLPRDLIQAKRLYRLAADAGGREGADRLKKLLADHPGLR